MNTIDPTLLDCSNTPPTRLPNFGHLPESAQHLMRMYDWRSDNVEVLCEAIRSLQQESEYSPWPWRPEHQIMWNDVDGLIVSLLNFLHLGACSTASTHNGQNGPHRTRSQPSGLEDSDFDDDEADALFVEIDELRAAFSQRYLRRFLVSRPMNARQRRQVHCVAQGKRLGHMAVGCGSLRMVLLSRFPEDLPVSLKRHYKIQMFVIAKLRNVNRSQWARPNYSYRNFQGVSWNRRHEAAGLQRRHILLTTWSSKARGSSDFSSSKPDT